MTGIVLYGIPNCDTVKKARAALDDAGIAYRFHDYKKLGVPEDRLRAWVAEHGWERVLNRSGTTFRKLPESDRADLDAERAIALMLLHPSAIRRPVAETGNAILIGFDPAAYAAIPR